MYTTEMPEIIKNKAKGAEKLGSMGVKWNSQKVS